MKNMQATYTEHYVYTSKDADHQSLIKPSSIINYFIQIAWMHAEKLDMGYSQLQTENKAWVLSKFSIQLNRIPTWPGKLSIETWPKRQERLFYLRDALLFDEKEELLGKITSSWLVIDINTKRPKVLNNASEEKYHKADAIEENTESIKVEGEHDFEMDYQVRYNDIDVNHHLTTVRYLELLFDTYDLDFIHSHSLKELHVNFIREIKFGDQLKVIRYRNEENYIFEITTSDKSFTYFRGKLIF
jgi:acyl-ACP thioesterase